MILVIAEKPSVANTIASVLGATDKQNGYIKNEKYIISWCLGHLVSLASPERYGTQYAEKPWKFENLPIIPTDWKFNLDLSTKAQFDILKSLMFRDDVTEIVCATDAGREGECIFRYVYNYANCHKPVKRLWTSSLESSAIKKGFNELKNDSYYNSLYEAGFARAKADWLVGMNATRLFSIRHKTALSVGRVQTPTLAMIVDRDYKVKNFIKEKFYTVDIDCGDFIAFSERIDNEISADNLAILCNGNQAIISSLKRDTKTVNPPKLYDLTTLQREANRLCGYTAQQTLDYTQSLYEQKLVTYPRTDSRFITEDMEQTVTDMVGTVSLCFSAFSPFVKTPNIKRCINNSNVSDHHAIIPTKEILNANIAALPSGERNILALIASRLLLSTSEPYIYESVKITVRCANHDFFTSGKKIISNGFKELEKAVKSHFKNTDKDDKNGNKQIFDITAKFFPYVSAKKSEHFTAPPKLYTEDTLLSAMESAGNSDYTEDSDVEKKGLGTPATRAGIIETLVKREFIKRDGKKLIPTEKGISLIKAVPDEVKSPKMTADWETSLQNIEKGISTSDEFMSRIISFTNELVKKYSSVDESYNLNFRRQSVGTCPKCGKKVIEYPKSYSCESGKDGCGFVIWKTIAGKSISSVQAEKLLTKGKSDLLKGFMGKSGKSFDARLKLNQSTFSVEFEFPNKFNGGKKRDDYNGQ